MKYDKLSFYVSVMYMCMDCMRENLSCKCFMCILNMLKEFY